MSGVNLPSFDGQPETRYTRVSIAVRIRDPLVLRGELIGAVSLQADGLVKPPIRNLSGWFVFTDLVIGSKYTLRIESEHYMPPIYLRRLMYSCFRRLVIPSQTI
jgi:hypothetical protein